MKKLLLLLLLSAPGAFTRTRAAEPPPNIVMILADDMGYGDLACYGHPSIRTPNLDRMAAEGMRFTDFYVAAELCTPSRAALLTGRYAVRSGMCDDQFRVLRARSKGHLPSSEVTIAQVLQGRGYATAMVGKWHLGNWAIDPAGHPMNFGFDSYYGLPHSNDMNPTPLAPKKAMSRLDQQAEWWAAPLYRGYDIIEQPADQSTLTRRYTAEAVKFIHEHKAAPFFLYYAHTFPHTPLFASSGFRGHSAAGLYGDVIEELDWSVGEVLQTLRKEGLEKNTLVFFTSDNGPALNMERAGGSAGPLREGKGSTWEGGMREPGIAWWPGRVPAGAVQHELASTMDLFVTFAELGGGMPPQDRAIDGVDILPLLEGKTIEEHPPFFYYRGTQLYAVRIGAYKAHLITHSGYGPEKPEMHHPPLLFDLGADPGERFDVASEHPEVLAQVADAVAKHRAGMVAAPSQLREVAPLPAGAAPASTP